MICILQELGTPMNVAARVQINIRIQPYEGTGKFHFHRIEWVAFKMCFCIVWIFFVMPLVFVYFILYLGFCRECNMLIFCQVMFYFIYNIFIQHPEGPAKCLPAHAVVRGEGWNAPRHGSFNQNSSLPLKHSNINHCLVSVSGYWGHSGDWHSAGPLATTSGIRSTPWSFNVTKSENPYKWLDVRAESLFDMKEFCLFMLWQFSNQYFFYKLTFTNFCKALSLDGET